MNRTPEKQAVRNFRKILAQWFNENKRSYPWRKTKSPYRLLIAEMMLQRTKADQVLGVYRDFFSYFRTPSDVARANIKTLKRILYPLGLHYRIKKFRECSKSLINNFGGKVPISRSKISKLPGVGDYIAGIVLSIAFNKKEWIVDSNVVRVFKRYFGILTSKEGRRDKHIIGIAKIYVNCKEPSNANFALLDFAALICTPRSPEHGRCPLSKNCQYFIKELKKGV